MFYEIYEKDEVLEGNLRKAPKLTFRAIHPGNNKQAIFMNVRSELSIMTTADHSMTLQNLNLLRSTIDMYNNLLQKFIRR